MKIKPKILFLTNRDDFTCDFLIDKIINSNKNLHYFRLNSDDINKITFYYNGKNEPIFLVGDNEYDLLYVKSIYFRRAATIFPETADTNDLDFINRERRDFIEGILLSLNIKWVNPIFSTFKAERKLYQLSIANKIGLKIPHTLVTNDPIRIREFLKNNEAIIKPISHGLQITKKNSYSIYTSKIKKIDLDNDDSLFEVPSLIQKKISNKQDIRVTIVDQDVFSVSIKKDRPEEIDWRKIGINKIYSTIKLPESLVKKLIQLNKELDLVYSAIDLILTENDDYIFLEINPAGEWVWLERELNLPISNSIINSLGA